MTTFLLQQCSQGTETSNDLYVHKYICKHLEVLVAKIKLTALEVTLKHAGCILDVQSSQGLETYQNKDFKAWKTPGIVFLKVMSCLKMQIGAYSGVLKTSRQMPPCMARHLNTSAYQSLSLSDLQWVLILTSASVINPPSCWC